MGYEMKIGMCVPHEIVRTILMDLGVRGRALQHLFHPTNGDEQNEHNVITKTELRRKPAPNLCLG